MRLFSNPMRSQTCVWSSFKRTSLTRRYIPLPCHWTLTLNLWSLTCSSFFPRKLVQYRKRSSHPGPGVTSDLGSRTFGGSREFGCMCKWWTSDIDVSYRIAPMYFGHIGLPVKARTTLEIMSQLQGCQQWQSLFSGLHYAFEQPRENILVKIKNLS